MSDATYKGLGDGATVCESLVAVWRHHKCQHASSPHAAFLEPKRSVNFASSWRFAIRHNTDVEGNCKASGKVHF